MLTLENLTGEGFRNVSLRSMPEKFWAWLGWWEPDAQTGRDALWSAYFAWRTHYAEWNEINKLSTGERLLRGLVYLPKIASHPD